MRQFLLKWFANCKNLSKNKVEALLFIYNSKFTTLSTQKHCYPIIFWTNINNLPTILTRIVSQFRIFIQKNQNLTTAARLASFSKSWLNLLNFYWISKIRASFWQNCLINLETEMLYIYTVLKVAHKKRRHPFIFLWILTIHTVHRKALFQQPCEIWPGGWPGKKQIDGSKSRPFFSQYDNICTFSRLNPRVTYLYQIFSVFIICAVSLENKCY